TNVVIQNVSIRRVGTAAQAFDISAQNLPLVKNLAPKISRFGGGVAIGFNNSLYADNRFYSSTNLGAWSAQLLGIETDMPLPDTILLSKDAPARFFSLAQIQYPSSTLAPKTFSNRTLTLNFSATYGVITNIFDSTGGGTYFNKNGTNLL